MDEALIHHVKQRAHHCCEYCGLSEEYSSFPFEIDHVIPRQHGGRTVAGNLALACYADNHHKGPNLAGIDSKTGKWVWLFNPRRQKWNRHFRWNGAVLWADSSWPCDDCGSANERRSQHRTAASAN
jgi:hypothetical protein